MEQQTSTFNPELIAQQIWDVVSPHGITAVEICMTRLRITLQHKELVDIAKIKAISGVLGVVDTPDQLQIIIGPGKVNQVNEKFQILLNTIPIAMQDVAAVSETKANDAASLKEKLKQKMPSSPDI